MTGNKTTQKSAWNEKLNRLEAEFNVLKLVGAAKESMEQNIKLIRTGIERYDNIRQYTVITNQISSLQNKIADLKAKHKPMTSTPSRISASTHGQTTTVLTAPTQSAYPTYLTSDPPTSFSCLTFVRSKFKTPSTSIPTTTPGLRA